MSETYFTPQPTGESTPVWELSGWWPRVGALIIDGIIVSIPIIIIGIVVGIAVFSGGTDANNADSIESFATGIQLGVLAIGFVVSTLYYCAMMPSTNGQTVGKMALGIRVVREDGTPITAGFAFLRQILVINVLFSWLGTFLLSLPILLDYLWPLWDNGNQALHDKIVKSRVVKAAPVSTTAASAQPPYPQQFPQTPGAPPPPTGPPAPPMPAAPTTPYAPPSPAVPDSTPADQRYVAPQQPTAPVQPAGPPAPPPPPGGTPTPYTPPPDFENPVPDDA
jgi:uncharacterized RDD family membrane protein YckC